MLTLNEQIAIAREFVANVAGGGIDEQYYAPDLTVWTVSTGLITRDEYLPRLKIAAEVWQTPLTVTIDSITAQPGRVVLQARSSGVLFTGQEYSNDYIFLIEFDDAGRIRHIREYFNLDRVRDIFRPAVAKWQEIARGQVAPGP